MYSLSLNGGGDGVSAPQPHALVAVDEQRGGLVAEVGLEARPDAQERLVRALSRGDLGPKSLHGFL